MHFINVILKKLKEKIKQYPRVKKIFLDLRHPIVGIFGYIYGAYLTIRYVDRYETFPAIIFKDGLIRLHVRKGIGSRFTISNKLIIQPLGVTRIPSLIQMGDDATVFIKGELIIGDDVRIAAFNSGEIYIGGKDKESASGISGRSIIMAYRKLVIGCDVIIAPDTFITDSDWHSIEGHSHHADTTIGNHVWIATGAKVLKGAIIGDDCIIGCSAVLLAGNYPAKSLIVGIPAKVTKSSITKWHRDLHEN